MDWKAMTRPTGTETRKAKRQPVTHDGAVFTQAGECIAQCRLRDVSAVGAQFVLQRDLELPTHFVLSLTVDGKVRRRCELVWQFATLVGVKFVSGE